MYIIYICIYTYTWIEVDGGQMDMDNDEAACGWVILQAAYVAFHDDVLFVLVLSLRYLTFVSYVLCIAGSDKIQNILYDYIHTHLCTYIIYTYTYVDLYVCT